MAHGLRIVVGIVSKNDDRKSKRKEEKGEASGASDWREAGLFLFFYFIFVFCFARYRARVVRKNRHSGVRLCWMSITVLILYDNTVHRALRGHWTVSF